MDTMRKDYELLCYLWSVNLSIKATINGSLLYYSTNTMYIST